MSKKIDQMILQVHRDIAQGVSFKVGLEHFTDLLKEVMKEIDKKLKKHKI